MALSPLKNSASRAVEIPVVSQPSKTYAFNFDTGEVSGLIDGKEAIRQFIRKAVSTARFRFLIYNSNYGCELEDIIGQDVPVSQLEAEIPRVITEALIYDDRINDVKDFVITRKNDALFIEFTVITRKGAITEVITV